MSYISHKQGENAELKPVYQSPPKVPSSSFQSKDGKDVSEFRNTREAFGDTSKPGAASQHRAADKFDDYSFKNLAMGNADDLKGVPSSNKFMGFVRDSGAVQTPSKTLESKTAIVQDAHPGMKTGFSPEMKMLAHGGSTLLFLLANLKMNKAMVPALRNTAIFGVLAGALINPSIFDPILGRFSKKSENK